ncbi:MAG: glycosyltransferase [Anaerolineales bacterium]|nr:glycosyltransferase [Anaerolineales bacterium]MCS7248594.1 glycosyltransferase [Anaerolineales bacterium]MDW8162407.1 glycosyltransferase [Anaerolineales bacterium]MDW8448325.1 glycosyltransferase [Anaerolineales bacterium]
MSDTASVSPSTPKLSSALRLGEALVQEGVLSPQELQRALELQSRTSERLGRILTSLGLVKRQQLYRVLAKLWGMPFVDLLQTPLDYKIARQFDPQELVRERFFPFARGSSHLLVATAEYPSPALLERLQALVPNHRIEFYVTTEWDIDYAIRQCFRDQILDRAAHGLYYRNPAECAFTVLTFGQYLFLVFVLLILIFGLYFATRPTLIALNFFINLAFLGSILFKFAVSLAGAKYEQIQPITEEEVASLNEEELPTYTILVPAYREAKVIPLLLDNLRRLDYPAAKLEILLLLEEDDQETIQAAYAAKPPEQVTFVIIPKGQPQTKPKACNVGLFFARGEYLVIYDAEDRPEPDQLKKAVIAFRKGPPNLVCVQAALNYFNHDENFLTRMFTLEYSYWFDYMLPGLDRWRLPIPLGGTSNHFRTSVLRQLGGWDPYNVTEDADLGIRAAANGYRVGVINSTTYEEANSQLWNWIRQRSRWIKGYIQTVLVHSRNPLALLKRAGLRNMLGFLMLIGGTPLTFLTAPVLWIFYLLFLLTGTRALDFLFPPLTLYISLFNLLFGNGLMIYLNMLAVFKRRYYHLLIYTFLNPIYWILHSIAAYKASWQLLTRPFYWEKTIHGLSRELWRSPQTT